MNEVLFWLVVVVVAANTGMCVAILMRVMEFDDKFDAYLAKYHKRRIK
jgi:hypothetical protein